MPDNVPAEVKQRRLAQVIDLQRQITGEIHAAQVGRCERVLLEMPSRRSPDELLGRTDSFRSVIVPQEHEPSWALSSTENRARQPATLFGSPSP